MKVINDTTNKSVTTLQEYSSLQKLAEAYAQYSNALYENAVKHWTTSDVVEFFVKTHPSYVMKHLYNIDARCYVINDFGYAKKEQTLEQKMELKHLKVRGKIFICRVFKTVDDANSYMEQNTEFGVIAEKGKDIYLAKV